MTFQVHLLPYWTLLSQLPKDRSMMVGHVPFGPSMFMCIIHMGMVAHPQNFMSWGGLWLGTFSNMQWHWLLRGLEYPSQRWAGLVHHDQVHPFGHEMGFYVYLKLIDIKRSSLCQIEAIRPLDETGSQLNIKMFSFCSGDEGVLHLWSLFR